MKKKRLSYGQLSGISGVCKITLYRFLTVKSAEVNIKNILKIAKFCADWFKEDEKNKRPSRSTRVKRTSDRGRSSGVAIYR